MGGPVVPPLGQFILKKGEWFKVIEWGGFTFDTLTYVITVQTEFRGFPIDWRRYGVAWVPYWQGDFREQERFTIYPGDLYLRVDLRSPLFDLGVSIERTNEK